MKRLQCEERKKKKGEKKRKERDKKVVERKRKKYDNSYVNNSRKRRHLTLEGI